jgi:hypothetical protein
MNKLEFNTHIKASVNICYDLARSVDFHKISVKEINEESVGGYKSGLISYNQHVLMKSTISGFIINTDLTITKYNPPFHFCYEGVNSVIKKIIHDYFFYDIGEETVMVDHFYYDLEYGILEDVINALFLKRYLTHLITHRNNLLCEYAESEKWKEVLGHEIVITQSFAENLMH